MDLTRKVGYSLQRYESFKSRDLDILSKMNDFGGARGRACFVFSGICDNEVDC